MTEHTGFDELIRGYRRFRETGWRRERARWAELAEGQSPRVLVISCSDSRVDPAAVFDAAPGEVFSVRNVANLVPPCEVGGGRHGVSAALEFAVTKLEVSEVVVMGHGSCGGVAAALSGALRDAEPGDGGFVAHWIGLLDEARERVAAEHGTGPDAAYELELEGVRASLANLRTFPFVAEREADGRLTLRGAWFGIREGELRVMGADGSFAAA